MFKSELDTSKAFTPLSIAVLAVSDTRTLETDTGGALLKLMEADGHRCAERAVCRHPGDPRDGMRWVGTRRSTPSSPPAAPAFPPRRRPGRWAAVQKRMEGFSVLFNQYSATRWVPRRCNRATGGLIGTTFVRVARLARRRDAWEDLRPVTTGTCPAIL